MNAQGEALDPTLTRAAIFDELKWINERVWKLTTMDEALKDKKGTGDKSATDMSMSGWLCEICEKSLEGGTKQKDYFKWHKKWYCEACYAIA